MSGEAVPTPPAPAGRPAQRRQYLTMLFADLSDSTRLGASMEAELYAALLEELHELYHDGVARYGGQVVRMQGDGMLAVFGLGEPSEDDGRRATEAALALHTAVKLLATRHRGDLAPGLSLHSGIHAGLVLVSEGDMLRGRVDLMGHAPNVAAKLADAARQDEILVSEGTLGPHAHRFRVSERSTLSPGGGDARLSVLRVSGLASNADRSLAGQVVGQLIGRERELADLLAALEAARGGTPGRIALQGPAGVGKSRLAQAFLEQCAAAGCTVLQGACDGVASGSPLGPFVQMLRTCLAMPQQQPASEGWDAAAGALTRLGIDAASERAAWVQLLGAGDGRTDATVPPSALVAALLRLTQALATSAPVVMFIDDWHWADDASHHLLSLLCSAPKASRPRLLLVLAARGFSTQDIGLIEAFEPIELQPLDDEATARCVSQLVPQANPLQAAEVCRYAGGNPLFIEELCHRLSRGGAIVASRGNSEDAAWLDLLIESRVARLPDRLAVLVRSAAVLGFTMPVWLFEQITQCHADSDAVRALAQQDLLFPGEQPETLRFKHAIARDAIYRSVGLHQRRALHLAAATALLQRSSASAEREDASEALAYHYAAAGDAQRAADFAVLAAQRAMRASALDRAQAQFRAALGALDGLDVNPDMARQWDLAAQGLGLACVFDPSSTDLPWFDRAIELARGAADPPRLARALYWRAYIDYALGNQRQAVQGARTALQAAADCGDARLHVQLQATLGQALVAAGRNDEALPWLERAVAVKREHRSGKGAAVGLVYSLITLGHAQADLGRFAEAQIGFDEAFALVGGMPHEVMASAKGLYAAVLLWQGRWAEAQDAATQSYRIGQQVRSLFTLSMGRAAAAYARWKAQGEAAAITELQEATAWLVPRGNRLFSSLNHGWLADALAHAGQRQASRHHAAQALQRARQLDPLGAPLACRAMATLAAREGDAAAVQRWLRRAGRCAQARGSLHELASNRWCEAQALAQLGQQAAARAARDDARAQFERLGMVWHGEPVAG
jgi:class 3 adenylate cyclase/tetratricopeptide (TPR) repeat protein